MAIRIVKMNEPLTCCFRDDEYACCRAPVNDGPHPLFCEPKTAGHRPAPEDLQQHCPLDDGPIQVQKPGVE